MCLSNLFRTRSTISLTTSASFLYDTIKRHEVCVKIDVVDWFYY